MCFVIDSRKDTSVIKNTTLFSKKILNILAFFLKSVTNIPFTRRGGTVGILILLRKRFKIDQYDLGPVFGSLNFLPRFIK